MSANIEVTLISIINNKDLFTEMIESSDASGEGDEGLSIPRYNKVLGLMVESLKNENDGRTLYNQLSLKNLKRCSLADFDERAGRFYLQPWLIAMIRQIDLTLIKYLSSAELDGLRRDLNGLYQRAISTEFKWVPGDEDYEEFRDHVYTTVRRIYTSISNNVRALQGRAIHLGNTLRAQDSNSMDHYKQQSATLKLVRKIYERNVIPTLEFLDERHQVQSRSDMKARPVKERTAIDALQGIVDTFGDHNLTDQAIRLQTLKTKLIGNSEIISNVRLSLMNYVLLERELRQFYDQVELRFDILTKAIEEKRNGRKKGSLISRNPELFSASNCIKGIKRHSVNLQPINLALHKGRLLLDNHIYVSSKKTPKPDPDSFLAPRELDRRTKGHHIAIHQLQIILESFDPFEPGEDVIEELHKYLSANWDRYELGYLWEALPMVVNSKVDKISGGTELKHITHGQYRLSYYPRFISYGVAS